MVLRWRQFWHIVKGTVLGAVEDKAPRLGAALAYYSVLALAPLIILVTPVAEALFGPSAHEEVAGQVAVLVGPQGTRAVRDVLEQVQYKFRPGPVARALSLAVLLFGASGVFAELQDALDTIWEVAPKPGRTAVLQYIRQRFISFAMVLGTGFLLVVSLLFSAALAALQRYADTRVQGLVWLWAVLGAVVSFGVTTVLFAAIFKVLPDVKVPWRGVGLGAVITSALFSIGRFLIGTYLGKASIGTAYGAAGSVVVLLIWIYYSAQILYLGAEFTKVYTRRTGTPAEPSEIAVPITEEARAQQGIAHQEVVQAVKEVVERKADEAEQAEAAETETGEKG
jgi:membrane protein